MKIEKYLKFLITITTLFCSNIKSKNLTPTEEVQTIEITQGRTRPITFKLITTNDLFQFKKAIVTNLENTQRFKETTTNPLFSIIIKKNADGLIELIVEDISLKKIIKKVIFEDISYNSQLKLSDEIYESITHEEGIFQGELIVAIYNKKNTCELYSLDSNKTNLRKISDKINNISDIFLCNEEIFVGKYSKTNKGFVILCFKPEYKKYLKILAIKNCTVHAPVLNEGDLYCAVTNEETTGIYKMPFTGGKKYSSFQEFKQDPLVNVIVEIKNTIATSISISENGKIAYCAEDKNKRPSIYLYPNMKISSDGESYFDPVVKNDYLAAIKLAYGKFNLVIINLKNGIEKTALSKYYISKPVWSPCGNWIAVSCREQGENDKIYLIHKSGKYVQIIKSNHKIKNIIWKNKNKK